MKHTAVLAALTLACSLQAQTTWTAQLSNPAFPLASATVEATMPVDTLLDPFVYFNATWSGVVGVLETTIQSELGGVIGGTAPDIFKVPVAQWPSKDLHGYEAKVWFDNYNSTLTGTFVPEPSTYAMIFGVGLVAFAAIRRMLV